MKQKWTLANTVIAELQDEGNRATKLRQGISEVLSENKRPFSRVEIMKALKKKGIIPNRTSFYRVLDDLVKTGILTPVLFHDHIPRYELVHHGHHHHVICTRCKTVVEIELSKELDAEERRITKQTGFHLTFHSLEFFGLCDPCFTGRR